MSEHVLQNRLLLISSSTIYGHGYLDHVEAEIRDFLGDGPPPCICALRAL